jgi:hypothetical protein
LEDTANSKHLQYRADVWYLDSAATHHLTPSKELLANFEEIPPFPVYSANKEPLFATGKGTAALNTRFRGELLLGTIREAYYVPGLVCNLLSTGKLTSNGFSINIDPRGCVICDNSRNIVAFGTHNNGLTELHNIPETGRANLTVAEIWHRRLGHPSDQRLEKASHTSKGIPHLSNEQITCTACSQGKQTRKAISKGPSEEPEFPLDIVHGDLVGPIATPSIGGAKYTLVIVDKKTRHTWVYFLKTKDETADTIDTWLTLIKNNTGEMVKIFFTDNGKEIAGQPTAKVLGKHGVIRKTTTPNTPEYNGIVEKRIHSSSKLLALSYTKAD